MQLRHYTSTAAHPPKQRHTHEHKHGCHGGTPAHPHNGTPVVLVAHSLIRRHPGTAAHPPNQRPTNQLNTATRGLPTGRRRHTHQHGGAPISIAITVAHQQHGGTPTNTQHDGPQYPPARLHGDTPGHQHKQDHTSMAPHPPRPSAQRAGDGITHQHGGTPSSTAVTHSMAAQRHTSAPAYHTVAPSARRMLSAVSHQRWNSRRTGDGKPPPAWRRTHQHCSTPAQRHTLAPTKQHHTHEHQHGGTQQHGGTTQRHVHQHGPAPSSTVVTPTNTQSRWRTHQHGDHGSTPARQHGMAAHQHTSITNTQHGGPMAIRLTSTRQPRQ